MEHDKFSVEEYGMYQQPKGFRSAAKDLLQAQDCAQRSQMGSRAPEMPRDYTDPENGTTMFTIGHGDDS